MNLPEQVPYPPGYPAELESDVLLADGRVADVRPIVPSDEAALLAMAGKLSAESVYLRFFSHRRELTPAEARHFVTVDYDERLALVAHVDGDLVAVARYERLDPRDEAEVAFTVRDDHQGRGLGTVLLEHLASAARARGIVAFVADTLAENRRMLGVFATAGFLEETALGSGLVRVRMSLDPVPRYVEQVEERDRRAAVRSITRLLRPTSVAVIGASGQVGTIGHMLFANLVDGDFRGGLYPVNPRGGSILGRHVYASLSEIPEPVDLAMIAVPAAAVPDVLVECGEHGVGGVVVISAGFAELGGDGEAAERHLVALAHRHGMRLIGPNCMGLVNTAPDVRLNATFAATAPAPGHIAFSTQSGGLGNALLAETARRGLGLSSFVSVGNKADVSSNDLIRYWDEDPSTELILLYLESFGNPRHFSRIARRVGRRKPIVAVKSGRSLAGSRGAASHTAALATRDEAVDALFRQAGVIRVETLEELFDVAELLSHQPLPAGRRVAIVGNAGGPGVLAADACEGYGLVVPEFSEETRRRLATVLPPGAAVGNPVDCIAAATPADYRAALEIVLADASVDAVIVIFTPPLVTGADDVARVVAEVAATSDKPVIGNFLAAGGSVDVLRSGARPVPWFAYPESAARALARVVPYAEWRARPESFVPDFDDIDRLAGRAVVEAALRASEPAPEAAAVWLSDADATDLCAAYGIVTGPAGAPTVRPRAIVTVQEDPFFGPLVALAVGDPGQGAPERQSVSLAPLTMEDAVAMIGTLGAAAYLTGTDLEPATGSIDANELAAVLCRVARLAEDLPEIAEIRLDPVVLTPAGSVALGAHVKVRRANAPAEPLLRRRHLR